MFCRWNKNTNAYLYNKGNESRNLARDMEHARYNNLNLPDSVSFTGGNTLQMSYLADGRRTRTTSKTYRTALTIPLDDVQAYSDPAVVHEEIQDGNKETIKIITHSMGAAYAKGYIKALLAFFETHNIPNEVIEFEVDFAPYQPLKQEADLNVMTYQFSHSKDWIAGDDKIKGAIFMNTSSDKNQTHWIEDFINQANKLPEGKYRIENNQLIPY